MQKQIILISLFLFHIISQQIVISLTDWKFQKQGDPILYPSKIPSTFATDLINNGLISKDLYYRDNFLQFYRYQNISVKYSTILNVPNQCLSSGKLILKGLDTHAEISLNSKKLIQTHNMFTKYQIPITNLSSTNLLQIQFNSSAKYDLNQQQLFFNQFGFYLPNNYSFTRKAAYQYGWDWGPRILTVGIWKQATFKCKLQHQINVLKTQILSPIKQKFPTTLPIQLQSTITNTLPNTLYTYTFLLQKSNHTYFNITQSNRSPTTTLSITKNISLELYQKNVSSFLWWTWDLGQPNLFNLTLGIGINNTPATYISQTIQTGFRTVTLIQQKDSVGSSFVINLNGINVFARGGNYIPPEMMMDRVNKDTYKQILKYALHGRFNMIRLWGGGQFQNQQFYKTMDQAGIMIWHDLMFACALYPVFPDQSQLTNIKNQMEDNLKRIGYHPSIALYNGNNQVWIGWQQWGWKDKLTPSQILKVQQMYTKIFKVILPSTISQYDPTLVYFQTSPSSSSGQLSTITSGDIHFWRVWAGAANIQEYQMFIGRFNSEWGMQSMPELSSIMKFTNQSDRVLGSYILRLHQRHIYGDKYLPMYTAKYAGNTTNLSRFAYFSQIMQAYALQMAIVSLRGNKPLCMGSLYWQLNDVWPVSSWATVDYYGTYKIAQYRVRQMHNQLLINVIHSPKINTTAQSWRVLAINDYDKKIPLLTNIIIMDINGTVLNSTQIEKSLQPFENLLIMRLNITLSQQAKKRSFIHVNAMDPTTRTIYKNNYYFVPPQNRTKLSANLLLSNQSSTKMGISSNLLATYIWLRLKNNNSYNFQSNYFDILPGQKMIVDIAPYTINDVIVSCYQCEIILNEKEKDIKDVLIQ